MCFILTYHIFLVQKILLRRMLCNKQFLQDVGFLVVKSHLPIQFAGSPWLKCVAMHLSSRIVFLSKTLFSQEVLLDLVKENKQEYVLPSWKHVIMQQNTYGYQKDCMMFLSWWLVFWVWIGSLNISQQGCLRQVKP